MVVRCCGHIEFKQNNYYFNILCKIQGKENGNEWYPVYNLPNILNLWFYWVSKNLDFSVTHSAIDKGHAAAMWHALGN